MEKRKQTAPLPLSSWPACWNDTCPFITGEIGSEEEEGDRFCRALMAVPTFEKQTTGVEAGSGRVKAPCILPMKSKFGSFTKAVEPQLNVEM